MSSDGRKGTPAQCTVRIHDDQGSSGTSLLLEVALLLGTLGVSQKVEKSEKSQNFICTPASVLLLFACLYVLLSFSRGI